MGLFVESEKTVMTTIEVPCLTIRQPWAGFVMMGQKPVENRTWSHGYCGPLLIHSSRVHQFPNPPFMYYQMAGISPDDVSDVSPKYTYRDRPEFQCGVILGVAIKGPCEFRPRQEPPSRWHDRGMRWWPLRSPVMFVRPIRYSGRLGIFEVEIDAATRLTKGGTLADYITYAESRAEEACQR